MRPGDIVRIYPHGSPVQAAYAGVMDMGEKAVALYFVKRPPFSNSVTLSFGPITMYLIRYDIGPWIEVGGGGHYEIEELDKDPSAKHSSG